MNTTEFKPKDLKEYLDIAYELLYKAHMYNESTLLNMQLELIEFKKYRAGLKQEVPSGIDAAIAARLVGISLDKPKS